MTLEISIACRRSPDELVGATSPIAGIEIGDPREMWLWFGRERTTRLIRESQLACVVTVTCVPRWADFAIQYAKLIARGFDGIPSINGDVLDDEPLLPLESRELALAWRDLEHRAQTELDELAQATRRDDLAWNPSAVWLDGETTPTPRDRPPIR